MTHHHTLDDEGYCEECGTCFEISPEQTKRDCDREFNAAMERKYG